VNPCVDEWEGIYCTGDGEDGFLHISGIYLPSYDLFGYLPGTIGNLSQLVNLTLTDSNFGFSTIPSTLVLLTNLVVLDLSVSLLTGSLPAGLDQLTNLIVLNLGDNNIPGTFPTEVCRLPRLELLVLEGNDFTGSIPSCLGGLTRLTTLGINNLNLNGTLPASLGSLVNLQILSVGGNALTGSIPSSYAAMTQLQDLAVENNLLTGPFPTYIGDFSQLQLLMMHYNQFSGTLPASMCSLPYLIDVFVMGNQLEGTLPNCLAGMGRLTELLVEHNRLTGTIPPFDERSTQLFYLALAYNHLSGTLPPSLGNMPILQVVVLQDNYFSGPLPVFTGDQMQGVTVLTLGDNLFTGTIPPSLLQLQSLLATELSFNALTGTIPSGTGDNTSHLLFFSCAGNQLMGSLPLTGENYATLVAFNASLNFLTGSIPDVLTESSTLTFLYLGSNLLQGTVPPQLATLPFLDYLFVDSNMLTGSLPASVGEALSLSSLNASSNFLTGTVPTELSQLSALKVLLLNDNVFTGDIEGVFNGDVQVHLATVQLSDNQLTGALPDSLALLPSLQVFAAVSNCFEGSIPESLCSSGSLNTLALDGLQSATSCQYKLFPAALEGSVVAKSLYSIRSPLSGGVPSCLFGMGNLTTLHLSGNGLTGTFSVDVTVSPALRDLSLSHNKLTGTIPASVLQRDWANLDLSYNRLTGSLPCGNGTSPYSSYTALSLENNRLSGRMPGALRHVTNISVLESNLFSCRTDRGDLPRHDKYRDKYECGSVTFDEAVYVWLALACVGAVALVLLYSGKLKVDFVQLLQRWWAASSVAGAPHLTAVHVIVRVVCQVAVVCAGYAVLVLLPMYAVCSAVYGTYTHQYAWALSAAYLSGSTAFAWEFACLAVLLVLTAGAAAFSWNNVGLGDVRASAESHEDSGLSSVRFVVYCAVVVFNFMVVLGVNTAYVIIALNQNGVALTLAQIALALFKVAFNSACSPVLMRWACQRFLGRQPSAPSYVTLQLFVSVVNNILVPCLVVAVISPSCFYNVFDKANDVHSHFQYAGECTDVELTSQTTVVCANSDLHLALTSYAPPFEYSYQCSSSFITYYSPAFVIMCMVAGFGIPLAQVVLQRLHERAVVGSRWHAVLDLVLPHILKPVHGNIGGAGIAVKVVVRNLYTPFFDASQHVITLLTYLALLLTFGAVFPPLAVCFAVTVVCVATFTRLKVGRFLTCVSGCSEDATNSPEVFEAGRDAARDTDVHTRPDQGYVAVLEQECEGVGSEKVLGRSVAMVVAFSCVFYTLFLFDTLGDAVGLRGAYWVLIVVPLSAVLLSAGFSFQKTKRRTKSADCIATRNNDSRAVELQVVRSPLPCAP
jgi:Leucine-rich repeat (LRR) protein